MTPWVTRLLVANVGVFLLQISMPSITMAFAYVPALGLMRPWTVITYMFLHGGMMHLLFNMIALYFFGPRIESRLGSKRFAILYFVSGVSGALVSTFFAPNSPIIGASAGVFGVMMAFAMFWPREKILIWGIIPMEIRVMVILTTIFALYSGFRGSAGGVADFAHLGGYAGAYIYLKWMERNSGARRFKKKVTTPSPKVEKHLATNFKNVNLTGVHDLTKEEVNRILDKIGSEGMESLTAEEKLFLSNFVPMDDRRPIS